MKTLLTLSLVAFAASALAGRAGAGQVAVFELGAGGAGDVRLYSEATGALLSAPPELQGIQLLPLEINGRVGLLEFAPDQARLLVDVPGAPRAALPRSQGSIYHYSRPSPGGGLAFGFFHVQGRGGARSVCELQGWGATGDNDPFLPRIAVARGGDAFLVITVPAAGGNVLEVRVAGAAPLPEVVDRTASIPPRRFYPTSLALSDSWGVVSMKRAVLRFDRAPSAQVSVVGFGGFPMPAHFSGATALSRNGQWAVTTAGPSANVLDVYAFSSTSDATKASQIGADLSGAGFEPEAQDGPHLAVADDGQTCAWRTEGVKRECWLGHVQAPAADPPEQLSSDARFLDTLDEVGAFVFRAPNKLHLAVGAQVAPGVSNLESTDLFQVAIPPALANVSFTNLTVTSGDTSVPFLAVPTITLSRAAYLADHDATWFFDASGQHGTVSAALGGVSGATTILANVKDIFAWEFTGDWAWIFVRRSDGTKPYEIWRVPEDLSSPAQRIHSYDLGDFSRHAVVGDGQAAFIASSSLTMATVERIVLATGQLDVFPTAASAFGPTIAFTSSGGVAFSELWPAGTQPRFLVWPANGGAAVLLQSNATDGWVLPGL